MQPLDAVRWDGRNIADVRQMLPEFHVHSGPADVLFITTEVATHSAIPGHWVVASHQMDVSVLAPEVFEKIYEVVAS